MKFQHFLEALPGNATLCLLSQPEYFGCELILVRLTSRTKQMEGLLHLHITSGETFNKVVQTSEVEELFYKVNSF